MKTLRKTAALFLALVMIFASVSVCACAKDAGGATVKNVILLIGDGMGVNSLEWTKAETGESLFMDTLPYQGWSETDSLSGLTDSAAGATALSCGKHVYNSNLGELAVLINGYGAKVCTYKNSCEVAKSLGKRAGVVTSDVNSGATPAGFSVHTYKRELTEEITNQQLACSLDLIWACNNGLLNEENVTDAGWTYADTMDDLDLLKDGERSFAAMKGTIAFETGSEDDAPLSQLTAKAINQLDCENGFFLMVEGAHIDKNSHSNNAEGMMKALLEFDKAVKTAVEFAEEDGNTIVIVTADHETGGITFNEDTGSYEYTTTSHTDVNVPLRVYGSGELVSDGEAVVNTSVADFTAEKLGCTDRYPSVSVNFLFVPELIKALFNALEAEITG